MSRIEKGQDTKEELAQMKGEMIKEIGSQHRGKPWCACSLIFLLIILGIVSGVIWALSATGFVSVPGFSKFAYHQPVPEHIVPSGVPMETVIDQQVKTILTQRLQAGGGKLDDTSVTFTVDEKSLTASLRNVLEQSGDKTIESAGAQVIVSPEKGFSFFLPFQETVRKTALQFSVKAQVHDGVLELRPESLSIGSLPIPNVLTAFFLQPFIHGKISELNKALGSYMELREIVYESGRVIITGNFSVQVMDAKQ